MESFTKLVDLARHGGAVDVILRRDGKEHRFEADWIKYIQTTEPYPTFTNYTAQQQKAKAHA